MSNNLPTVEIKFTDDFQRQIRKLAKRYRDIQTDLQPIIEQLQKGNFIGDLIPGVGYTTIKVRVKNSNIQKGKSAGYRLVYHIESPTAILLLSIYSKSDKTDISPAEIIEVIAEFYGESEEE
jgi:addiction module RelE/StbE family toxin